MAFRFTSLCLLLAALTTLAAAEPARKRVALIFDDGPDEAQSGAFVALLAKEGVRVSFANVGRNVQAHPELTRAAAAAGHEIVNHSFTHPHFHELDAAAIRAEVADTQAAVKAATGRAPSWFWAPFGEWDERIAAAVRAAGLEHYPQAELHYIATDDWDRNIPGTEIRRRATTGIRDGTVIICHEWRDATLAELPAILVELRRQGVTFVTFSELAADLP